MYKSMKNDDVHIEVALAGITVITVSILMQLQWKYLPI